MSVFKDMVANDLDTIMNLGELAEEHLLEGKKVTAVTDSDILMQRQGGAEFGISESDLVVFAKTSDLTGAGIKRKAYGAHLNVDGKEYTVISWVENMGLSQISLSQAVMN